MWRPFFVFFSIKNTVNTAARKGGAKGLPGRDASGAAGEGRDQGARSALRHGGRHRKIPSGGTRPPVDTERERQRGYS